MRTPEEGQGDHRTYIIELKEGRVVSSGIYIKSQGTTLTLEQLQAAMAGVAEMCLEEASFEPLRLMLEDLPHELDLGNEVLLQRDILKSFAKVESLSVDPYALVGANKIIKRSALDKLVGLRLQLARQDGIPEPPLPMEEALERERRRKERFRLLLSPVQVPAAQVELDLSPKAADVLQGNTALEGV